MNKDDKNRQFVLLIHYLFTVHSLKSKKNHCLYCDTTFPQFDDLIKHSRENHPYHCYYCKTTFVLFEEVIKHSTENHGSLMLKVKYGTKCIEGTIDE
jgi:NAD-dependent SIR2 family protein deacetylase